MAGAHGGVTAITRFGTDGARLRLAKSDVHGRWQWTLFDPNGHELAYGTKVYTRPCDARRGAWRTLIALANLRPAI